MRHLRQTIPFLFTACCLTACGDPVGQQFPSERALVTALGDYTVVGRFDLKFPATVCEILREQDGIHFRRGNTPQDYSGFVGYEMCAVRTDAGGREGWLVLRSAAKT